MTCIHSVTGNPYSALTTAVIGTGALILLVILILLMVPRHPGDGV